MAITEVGLAGVKPGLDIMSDTTPEGQLLSQIWKPENLSPNGPHRVYWGNEVEDPSMNWAFFDWDSVEHHNSFAKSRGREAVKDLHKLFSHGEWMKHLAMDGAFPRVLQSAIMQALYVYVPSDAPGPQRDLVEEQVRALVQGAISGRDAKAITSYGWGVEDDFPYAKDPERLGATFAVYIGWKSVDAHDEFVGSDTCSSMLKAARDIKDVVELKVVSLSCKGWERPGHGEPVQG